MDFVHLHTHSRHSLLDGLCSPQQIAEAAKEKGFSAIAITDHGSISGAIQHYKACKEVGIKPIIGTEFYFCEDVKAKVRENFHIILLAKSNKGLKSLYRLMTKGHQNFYYKP